jgi:hypothetical protein
MKNDSAGIARRDDARTHGIHLFVAGKCVSDIYRLWTARQLARLACWIVDAGSERDRAGVSAGQQVIGPRRHGEGIDGGRLARTARIVDRSANH